MTWEYLIGSEKDFEGAPDWCTHSSLMFWLMDSSIKLGNKYQMKGADSTNTHNEHNSVIGSKIGIIAQRRKRKSNQWHGVGLPPVGCECEALIPYRDEPLSRWRKVRVICLGDEFNAAGELIVVDLEDITPHWTDEFRPLRTKEQIERDEAVKDMVYFLEDAPLTSWEDIAGRIFDAGYRKTK